MTTMTGSIGEPGRRPEGASSGACEADVTRKSLTDAAFGLVSVSEDTKGGRTAVIEKRPPRGTGL